MRHKVVETPQQELKCSGSKVSYAEPIAMAGKGVRASKRHALSKQKHSTLIHPVVNLWSFLKDQLPRLSLQPLLTSRQIKEVLVRPLHIDDFNLL